MKRPVLWSHTALDDIRDQVAFIARENPGAARRIADRIRETGNALGERAIGRQGRVAGTYEKSITGLPYIVVYTLVTRAGREIVAILRVVHTARDWPPATWPD